MLSQGDILRIAHLARIAVTDDEARALQGQFTGIFELIEQMRAVDTTGITPMSHGIDVVQRLREDVVSESDQHKAFQTGAPAVEEGLYLVPKVIE